MNCSETRKGAYLVRLPAAAALCHSLRVPVRWVLCCSNPLKRALLRFAVDYAGGFLVLSLSGDGFVSDEAKKLMGMQRQKGSQEMFRQDALCKQQVRYLKQAMPSQIDFGQDRKTCAEDGRLHRIRSCLEPRPAVSLRWPFSERHRLRYHRSSRNREFA